jgi:hypothetical protein
MALLFITRDLADFGIWRPLEHEDAICGEDPQQCRRLLAAGVQTNLTTGLPAEAIRAEGIAAAGGIQEMNNALAGTGGEALLKLQGAQALQGKKIMLLPVSEGGMNQRCDPPP